MTERFERGLDGEMVQTLVEEKLVPLGVVAPPDGEQQELKKIDPLLALKFRAAVVPERLVNAVTTVFKPLFLPPVVVAVLGGLVALDVWLFGYHGVAQSVRTHALRPPLHPVAARSRRAVRSLPRVRPCHRLPLRRRAAGRDGRRPLHRVAGVLHRRHRCVPPRQEGAAPHRPRRRLLQHDLHLAHRRGVFPDRLRAAAADHPASAPRDPASVPAVHPPGRLLHHQRSHRSARHVRAHQAGAEEPCCPGRRPRTASRN